MKESKKNKLMGDWVNDWAKWRAVDANGFVYEYEEKPRLMLTRGEWGSEGNSRWCSVKAIGPTCKWYKTLQKRQCPQSVTEEAYRQLEKERDELKLKLDGIKAILRY